jgi:serine/threonine-protein kinase
MAPEAIEGVEIDTRADIYCLGAVAYFLVTGLPPFQSPSTVQMLVDHVKTAPRPPSELTDCALPRELEEIVLRCLGKRPADRYQTAEELEDALRAVPLAEPWTRAKARAFWQRHLGTPNEASSVLR